MDRVFLDANILFPLALRDLFVELDRAGAIEALWSNDVQREWRDNALEKHRESCEKQGIPPTWTEAKLQRQNDLLDLMLPGAKVSGYESLIPKITGLHDADDRHVVAAAIQGHADVVISHDKAARLRPVLLEHQIALFSADDYLMELINRQGVIGPIIAAVRRQRQDYKNPPVSAQELIDRYAANNMPGFAKALQQIVPRL